MSIEFTANLVDQALKRLNEKMVYSAIQPIEFVVCGGAALVVTGLISRTTRDVDILALATSHGQTVEFLANKELSDGIRQLIAEIGAEMRMEPDWLNFAASPLLNFGLPPGIETRLKKKSYGQCLTVYFINRFDQVHLKIYAAMDREAGARHLSDLIDLEPTLNEAKSAAAWLLRREISPPFRAKLNQVLERIGHEGIAESI